MESLPETNNQPNLPKEYVIQKGDRLLSIVNKLVPGLSYKERIYACFVLRNQNPEIIRNIHLIHPGKKLQIPSNFVEQIRAPDIDWKKVNKIFAAESERFEKGIFSKTQLGLFSLKRETGKIETMPKQEETVTAKPKFVARSKTPKVKLKVVTITPKPGPKAAKIEVKANPPIKPHAKPKKSPEPKRKIEPAPEIIVKKTPEPTVRPVAKAAPSLKKTPLKTPEEKQQEAPKELTERGVLDTLWASITRNKVVEKYVKPSYYNKYGREMYREKMNYPVPKNHTGILTANEPLAWPLGHGKQSNEGSDASGWVPITTADGATYFRAEYHLKDLDLPGEPIFDSYTQQRGDRYTPEKMDLMREGAKLHILSFSAADFDLAYVPGATLLRQEEDGSRKGFFNGGDHVNPAAGKILASHTKLSAEMADRAVAVFNGTYHQEDNVARIGGKAAYGGLVVNGKEIIRPHPALGTVATYEDGAVRMGTYQNLPEKDRIKSLRQNLRMFLENGQTGPEALGNRLFRFEDNLVSSYLATDARGNIAYIFGTNVPPKVMAETLKRLGYRDAMLLDIHPVISARVAQPGSSSMTKDGYDFVPYTRKGFQWHYPSALRGSPHDFFAILRKSPEELQVSENQQYSG